MNKILRKNIFIFISIFLLSFLLISCRKETKTEIDIKSEYKETMLIGEEQEIKLDVQILKGKKGDINIKWKSSNEKVLTVTNDGVVNALIPGKTSVIATIEVNELFEQVKFEIEVKDLEATITYVLDGGTNSSSNPTTITTESLPVTLKPATKDGYEFVGWELNGNIVSEIASCENITLTAKWEAVEYLIEYNLDGGTLESSKTKYTVEEEVELPTPTKEGYKFLGWELDGKTITKISKGTMKNLELVAKWEKEVVYSNINFDLAGGTFTSSNIPTKYAEGEGLSSLPNATKAGCKFLGWHVGDVKYESISKDQTGEINLVAKWEVDMTPTIEYNFNGGISEELYVEKGTVTASITVTRFKGNFWGEYSSNVFFFNQSNDIKPTFSYRIYIGVDKNSNLYKVVHKVNDGGTTEWVEGAEYVITISSSHSNVSTYKTAFNNIKVGDIAILSGDILGASTTPVKVDFYNTEPENKTLIVDPKNVTKLIVPTRLGFNFLGWYDAEGNKYENPSQIGSYKVLTAKWEALTPVVDIKVENLSSQIVAGTTYQLNCSVVPSDAFFQEILYSSSNEDIFTVDANGLITTYNTGVATLTIKDFLGQVVKKYEITVYAKPHIVGSYETNSYVEAGQQIQLNAEIREDEASIIWSSKDESIATVDQNGLVTAHKNGLVTIVATSSKDSNLKMKFVVTVLTGNESNILKYLLSQHNSNIYSTYDLGIGAGVPVYYADIYGSVNKLLMNDFLEVDRTLKDKEVQANTGDYYNPMESVEFITVHYTGNMSKGANAKANADYFVGNNDVSIHYATGNDGVFQALDHSIGAWHAGDSGALAEVGAFKWMPTGVKVGENDPEYPEFTISNDFYYEINGQKTSVKMPNPWNYSGRNTDHTLNADGTISSKAGYGGTSFKNRTPESFINDMGLPFTIVDGEYYMGTTWWCYTQVYEGRICSTGGNRNSIGIESCVDLGSDLWYTWQKTAQLVAQLMVETNLDITRVRGHHFFAGKDCPQPMLENDLEIWWEFIDMVEAEYEMLTTYSDYEISIVSNNPDIVDDKGRVVSIPEFSTTVTYTITVKKAGQVVDTITLASVIPGFYESVCR